MAGRTSPALRAEERFPNLAVCIRKVPIGNGIRDSGCYILGIYLGYPNEVFVCWEFVC
jgi:hypothetical protein